jgi:glycerol uptake facilitator-like aquaporin
MSLARRVVAEGLGTAFLLAIVVGSGIMGERLAGGNTALALLANALATGSGLTALILAFGPISGAHFNPVVTLATAFTGGMAWRQVPSYLGSQVIGAFVGVAAAHLMFNEPPFSISQHARTGAAQWWSECVATFGLVFILWSCLRHKADAIPLAVGVYITAAYWFTASTSFANPAVTLARAVTDTFSGIRPQDTAGFILAQLAGGTAAIALFRWIMEPLPPSPLPDPVRPSSAPDR